MITFIDGVDFINKGAELMLRSVVKRFKNPDIQIVVRDWVYALNSAYCIENNILPVKKIHSATGVIKHKVKKRLFNKKDYLLYSDVECLIDAGGFQFGDQWVQDKNQVSRDYEKIRYYIYLKKKKAKIIFLPQAFGPFNDPVAIDIIKHVFVNATRIYARDKESYNHLTKIFGNCEKICLGPDITIEYACENPIVDLIQNKKYVALIPNAKMLTKTSKTASTQYFFFMKDIIDFLIGMNERIIFLNHGGKDDLSILLELKKELKKEFIILDNLSAEEVKSLIGKMKLVVTSRFHGLISGLSQNIPTLCTSWSHKYEELLSDFGVSDNILNIRDIEKCKTKIQAALKDHGSGKYTPSQEIIGNLKEKNKLMWIDVFDIINQSRKVDCL